jgi:hypothetical protein
MLITATHAKDPDKVKRMVKESDIIVAGKVQAKKASWNAQKTKIYTKTTLAVDEVLKGKNTQNTLEIVTPGGEVDGVGELYTHMPRFDEDEQVVVFLKKEKNSNLYKVHDGENGKIKLITDATTQEKTTVSKVPYKELRAEIKRQLEK